MNVSMSDIRVRRPREHEALIHELQERGSFPAMRDVLLFAAAVGYRQGRRVPFSSSGEPIRYGILIQPPFGDTLVNLLATNVVTDDPEILDIFRLQERVTIFEEYANGGLEYIQEQVNARRRPPARIVIELVTQAFEDTGGVKPVTVDDLLQSITWG